MEEEKLEGKMEKNERIGRARKLKAIFTVSSEARNFRENV